MDSASSSPLIGDCRDARFSLDSATAACKAFLSRSARRSTGPATALTSTQTRRVAFQSNVGAGARSLALCETSPAREGAPRHIRIRNRRSLADRSLRQSRRIPVSRSSPNSCSRTVYCSPLESPLLLRSLGQTTDTIGVLGDEKACLHKKE